MAGLFETLFETCADGVLVIDASGHIERANATAIAWLGLPGAAAHGVAPSDRLPAGSILADLEVHSDRRVELADGSSGRLVRFHAAPPRPTGPNAATGGPGDALLRMMLNGGPDLVTRHRPDGTMTFASNVSTALLGRTPNELVDAWGRVGSVEDGLGQLNVHLRRCVSNRSDEPFTWRHRGPDGVERWMESRTLVHTDAAGDPIELIVISRDVSGRLEAESALAASEDRFRVAFEASPIGMSVVAADGSVLEANEAASAMTGYSRDEMRTMHAVDLTTPEDWPTIERAFRRIFVDGESQVSFEKRYVRSDGEVRWDEVHATVIERRDGQPWRLLVQSLDVTERREVDRRLRHLADHDPLTGLLNRRSFEGALREHQCAVAEGGARGAVLVLDLDHFKYVNDSLGHHAGDQLICSIADVLTASLHQRATVARLGGDEFAVLLPTGGAMEARVVAETLIDAVRETTVQLRGGSRRKVTTSVGVALFDGYTQSADDMLVSADLAMYDAKEEGRNRWALASRGDAHDRRRTRSRVSWVERIERALEGDDFELFAQPILDLRNGTVGQYELLLRMREPDGSLTLPGEFLAVAERLDLIQGIDRWVTTRAIQLLADHQRSGRPISFEINLSGRSLNDVALLELISSRIGETGVDPHGLIFEVTETAAVSDIPAARNLAHSLADLGCRFALDDFGAGFGSFYYLKYLPFDFLKIDGEFVTHCTSDATDKTIIRALVDVARQLGKQTVAEFTGDAATLRFLRKEGVDHAQGYHIGRPLPLVEALGPAVLPFTGPGLGVGAAGAAVARSAGQAKQAVPTAGAARVRPAVTAAAPSEVPGSVRR